MLTRHPTAGKGLTPVATRVNMHVGPLSSGVAANASVTTLYSPADRIGMLVSSLTAYKRSAVEQHVSDNLQSTLRTRAR